MIWISTFVILADTHTIQPKEIQSMVLHQELLLRIFQMTGVVQFVAYLKICSSVVLSNQYEYITLQKRVDTLGLPSFVVRKK